MTPILLNAIYVASFVVCVVFIVKFFTGGDPFHPEHLAVPGVAGFAIFPVMNTLVAVAILLYWVFKSPDSQGHLDRL